jgi:hypothetical protein
MGLREPMELKTLPVSQTRTFSAAAATALAARARQEKVARAVAAEKAQEREARRQMKIAPDAKGGRKQLSAALVAEEHRGGAPTAAGEVSEALEASKVSVSETEASIAAGASEQPWTFRAAAIAALARDCGSGSSGGDGGSGGGNSGGGGSGSDGAASPTSLPLAPKPRSRKRKGSTLRRLPLHEVERPPTIFVGPTDIDVGGASPGTGGDHASAGSSDIGAESSCYK